MEEKKTTHGKYPIVAEGRPSLFLPVRTNDRRVYPSPRDAKRAAGQAELDGECSSRLTYFIIKPFESK